MAMAGESQIPLGGYHVRPLSPISFGALEFWAGALVAVLSAAIDAVLAEPGTSLNFWSFALPPYALLMCMSGGWRRPGIVFLLLAAGAAFWPYVSSALIGESMLDQVRALFRVSFIVFFFVALAQSKAVSTMLPFVIGLYFGYVSGQVLSVFYEVSGAGLTLSVKHSIANTALLFYIVFFMRDLLSRPVWVIFIALFIFFMFLSYIAESRTMVLAPLASLGVLFVARYVIANRVLWGIGLLLMPLMPVLLLALSFQGVMQTLVSEHLVTASNVERLMLMFLAAENIIMEPLLGVGRGVGASESLIELYTSIGLHSLSDTTVHNVYLELASFHGIPSVAFYVLFFLFFFMKVSSKERAAFSAQVFLLSVIMLEYALSPFTAVLKLDTFVVGLLMAVSGAVRQGFAVRVADVGEERR